MFTLQDLIAEIQNERNYLEETYLEVSDPNNSNKTILVYKGFEDLIYENEP